MVLGRFFWKEEPMYDKVFCLVLVLRKWCLSFAKLFLVSILQCGAIQRFHSDKKDNFYWQTWKLLHLCIDELFL